MANLLDNVKEYITPELLGQAANLLGEHENGISKAIGGFVPTILAGLLEKTDNSDAMNGIFNSLSNFDSGILNNLGGLLGGGNLAHNDPKDLAGHLMGTLFGSKVPAITSAISSFAGIKSGSASSLLGLVGPMVMGMLSKRIGTEGLNVSGLANLLLGQKSNILNALPAGLGSVLGLATGNVELPKASGNGMRWLWPLLLLLGLGAVIIYSLRTCSGKTETAAVSAPAAPAPAPAPETPKLSFPAGTEESKMLAFIQSNAPVDKTTWFNFPEIMFDVNKATLKPESEAKLNAVLSVLKTFPAVTLKVGGYTDSDGNDQANLKLSDERAKACKAWLEGKGIAPERLEAEGYGEQHPVAANDTPENKAKNRRISFRVTAK